MSQSIYASEVDAKWKPRWLESKQQHEYCKLNSFTSLSQQFFFNNKKNTLKKLCDAELITANSEEVTSSGKNSR